MIFQLNLFCSGSPLEDEVNLAVLENLTVDLTIPLLGGKVHGSLARAGKVRGQTPKASTFNYILTTFYYQVWISVGIQCVLLKSIIKLIKYH